MHSIVDATQPKQRRSLVIYLRSWNTNKQRDCKANDQKTNFEVTKRGEFIASENAYKPTCTLLAHIKLRTKRSWCQTGALGKLDKDFIRIQTTMLRWQLKIYIITWNRLFPICFYFEDHIVKFCGYQLMTTQIFNPLNAST